MAGSLIDLRGFYQSPEWMRVRRRVLVRDNYCCVLCKMSVRAKKQSRVDHIVPLKKDYSRRFDMTNLRTLCPACDNARHRGKSYKEAEHGVSTSGFPLDPDHPWNK
jgi:5-methylcytosine-specific restriction endonuclease McrA